MHSFIFILKLSIKDVHSHGMKINLSGLLRTRENTGEKRFSSDATSKIFFSKIMEIYCVSARKSGVDALRTFCVQEWKCQFMRTYFMNNLLIDPFKIAFFSLKICTKTSVNQIVLQLFHLNAILTLVLTAMIVSSIFGTNQGVRIWDMNIQQHQPWFDGKKCWN